MGTKRQLSFCEEHGEAKTSLWQEAFFAAELLLLHTSPVFYGLQVPRGDHSGVVLVPGFLGSDIYLSQMYGWLRWIGYRPYLSGIRFNAHCPDLLIRNYVNKAVDRALKKTHGRVHLIGHSLGGIMARSIAAQRPDDIASVITLGSPFRKTVAHRAVLKAAETVRLRILQNRADDVQPQCYTGRCGCEFLEGLRCTLADHIIETAVFTRNDGIVDWRYCVTDDQSQDFEVGGTHVGLVFNPSVYSLIAKRLALTHKTNVETLSGFELKAA